MLGGRRRRLGSIEVSSWKGERIVGVVPTSISVQVRGKIIYTTQGEPGTFCTT